MYKNKFNFFLAIVLSVCLLQGKKDTTIKCAISHGFSYGRFGDNLFAYLHAKYLAYKEGVPFLYKPFANSDGLKLHALEKKINDRYIKKHFKKIVEFKKGDSIHIEKNKPILYVVPYFPECLQEFERPNNFFYFAIDWEDPGFRKLLQQLVQPNFLIKHPELPTDKITVALHVRRNSGGYDAPLLDDQEPNATIDTSSFLDVVYPLKVVPNSYYIEQLRWLSEFFQHAPLYVYLLTDDPNPKKLADYYANALNLPNIEFAYRKVGNHHAANVLEDFFFMTKFDCLIRSESNYSLSNACIFDYQIMIAPEGYTWKDGRIYINKVKREIKNLREKI